MRRPSRRTVLKVAAVAVVLLVIANVTGLVRYPGGPLSQASGWFWLDIRGANQGYNGVGVGPGSELTTGIPMYIGIFPRNEWPVTATIERAGLLNATPGLRLVEARLVRPGTQHDGAVGIIYGSGEQTEALGLYTDYDPLPQTLAGSTSIEDGVMWVEVIADVPGEHSFGSVFVDYRVGPFSFRADMYQSFSACIAPMPSEAVCSWVVN
jgi:hypothetical protein